MYPWPQTFLNYCLQQDNVLFSCLPFFIQNFTLFGGHFNLCDLFIFIQSFGDKFPVISRSDLALCLIVLLVDSKRSCQCIFTLGFPWLGNLTMGTYRKRWENIWRQSERKAIYSPTHLQTGPGRACPLSVFPCLVTGHSVQLLR